MLNQSVNKKLSISCLHMDNLDNKLLLSFIILYFFHANADNPYDFIQVYKI